MVAALASTVRAQIQEVPPPAKVYLWLDHGDAPAAVEVVRVAQDALRRSRQAPLVRTRDESDLIATIVATTRGDGGVLLAVAFVVNTTPLPAFVDLLVVDVAPDEIAARGRYLAEETEAVVREFHALIRTRRR
jgi:hypothetical protein